MVVQKESIAEQRDRLIQENEALKEKIAFNAKLTGKISRFESGTEGSKLTLQLNGVDQFGKAIVGEVTINCSPALIKNLKLHDLLTLTLENHKVD